MWVYSDMRQGERFDQLRGWSVAQRVSLPVWQAVQALGILYWSLIFGVIKRNVWLRTFTFAMVCAMAGM